MYEGQRKMREIGKILSVDVPGEVIIDFDDGKEERNPTVISDRVGHRTSEYIDKNSHDSGKLMQSGNVKGNCGG